MMYSIRNTKRLRIEDLSVDHLNFMVDYAMWANGEKSTEPQYLTPIARDQLWATVRDMFNVELLKRGQEDRKRTNWRKVSPENDAASFSLLDTTK